MRLGPAALCIWTRIDFPESGALETSAFTSLRMKGAGFEIQSKPVAFTRVRPGESLLNG